MTKVLHHNRCSFKFQGVCILNQFQRSFLVCFMSGNLMFSARNFTKSVWTPNNLFYIVFIDFMALLKYNRFDAYVSSLVKLDPMPVVF